MSDLEELTAFLDIFHKEIGIDQKDIDGYRKDAENFIHSGNMYFWKDRQGNSVADYSGFPAHPGRSLAQPGRASAHLMRSAVQLMLAANQRTC